MALISVALSAEFEIVVVVVLLEGCHALLDSCFRNTLCRLAHATRIAHDE